MAGQSRELTELERMERGIAGAIADAGGRIRDPDIAQRVSAFGEAHARHADEIAEVAGEVTPSEDVERLVERLVDGIERSTQEDALLVAALQAERRLVNRHAVAIESGVSDDTARVLRRQQSEDQSHVDYLESQAAVLLPELNDLGDADGEDMAIP